MWIGYARGVKLRFSSVFVSFLRQPSCISLAVTRGRRHGPCPMLGPHVGTPAPTPAVVQRAHPHM